LERCIDCQYYDRNSPHGPATKSAHAGQCRRHAPTLSPLNAKAYMIEGVWPTIRDDDWCGEWKSRARRGDTRAADALIAASLPATALNRVGSAVLSPTSIGTAFAGDD
jgi:hypothetical protein